MPRNLRTVLRSRSAIDTRLKSGRSCCRTIRESTTKNNSRNNNYNYNNFELKWISGRSGKAYHTNHWWQARERFPVPTPVSTNLVLQRWTRSPFRALTPTQPLRTSSSRSSIFLLRLWAPRTLLRFPFSSIWATESVRSQTIHGKRSLPAHCSHHTTFQFRVISRLFRCPGRFICLAFDFNFLSF